MKFFLLLFLSLELCTQAQSQASSFFPDEMVVTSSALNLRESPDKNSKKIVSLPQGSVVQFVEAWNNGEYTQADTTDPNSPYAPWLKVRFNGKTGWVFGAYVTATTSVYFESEPIFEDVALPPVYWYGVYARDSFADEIKSVTVRLEQENNEMYDATVKTIKTNQKQASKFLIASVKPLKTGYCGALGSLDVNGMYGAFHLGPGGQVSLYPGNDMNDTIMKASYVLAATGCARLEDTYVQVKDYALYVLDYSTEPYTLQDISALVKTESEEFSPSVDVLWYGDLDNDLKPDLLLQDCPYESGCRVSLYLSTRAQKSELLHKVSEHFWPGD